MTATNKQDWSNAPKHGILIHNDAKGLRVRLRRPALPYAPSRKQDLQEVFAMLDQAFQQVCIFISRSSVSLKIGKRR